MGRLLSTPDAMLSFSSRLYGNQFRKVNGTIDGACCVALEQGKSPEVIAVIERLAMKKHHVTLES